MVSDRVNISSFRMDPLYLIQLYQEGRDGPCRNMEPYWLYL